MVKYFGILIISISINFYCYGQEVIGRHLAPAPILESGEMNVPQYIQFMDNYWQQTPHNFKGSGIKPYLRWKQNVKYLTKENGQILSRDEIRESWENVVQLRTTIDPLDDNSNWIPIGPFNHENRGSWSSGQGRVNVTAVDPNNPNTIYIGTPDGGAWKSTDGGNSWLCMTLALPVWGVSGIAVDYNNSNTIYVATGDEDGWDSYANGVYKSTDGGQTWSQAGNITASQLGEIYIHPTDSNVLWVCSTQGLYKSTNGGASWTNVYSTNSVKEIRLKPNNPNVLYIVSQSNGAAFILKSTDGGSTFSLIKSYYSSGRTVIAVTPANPEVLYAMVSNTDGSFQTLDKSSNGGSTFVVKNNTTDIYTSNQAYYDLAIAVSPSNENIIFTGCLDIWKSTNSGSSFTQLNSWSAPNSSNYTHADIHDLKFYNGKLYASTDGGIYISNNFGASFEDKTTNGLSIGQIYRFDVAQNNQYELVAGLQDNGGYTHHANQWYVYYGADGMDCAIDPTHPERHYGFIQFGSYLYRYINNQANPLGSFVTEVPDGFSGNWISPLEFGEGGTLYAGYEKLFFLNSAGIFQEASTQYFPNAITEIKVAPNNDHLLLVSSENYLYQTDGTANHNFTLIYSGSLGNLQCFDYNRLNSNIIYMGTSQGVYRSVDGGATWSNFSGSLPIEDYKVAFIHQKDSPNNTVYLATRNAVYYRNDSMNDWQIFSQGLPHSRITDIKVNTVENHLMIATYGRGIWRSPVDSESLTVEDINDNNAYSFYPNPTSQYLKLKTAIDEKCKVEIYNLEGKTVYQNTFDQFNTDTAIDVSSLEKGIYVVKLVSPTHLITKKIIKQ